MASPDFNICDKCKTDRVPLSLRLNLVVDREMNGAGSMENVSMAVDLCHECTTLAVKLLLKQYGATAEMVHWLKQS